MADKKNIAKDNIYEISNFTKILLDRDFWVIDRDKYIVITTNIIRAAALISSADDVTKEIVNEISKEMYFRYVRFDNLL